MDDALPRRERSRRTPRRDHAMATKGASKGRRRPSSRRGADEDNAEDRGGTPRALWSGFISFGLLQIPISLHTAEKSNDLRFHQLDRHDMAPIRYQRVNENTGKPVEWKDIVRGYEYAPGEYVVIEDEDLAAANVEATQTIDLQDFVDVKAILPTFFERPYYVAPGKRAEKAYALFRDALDRKKVVAVGTVVIRTRQHLCALFPQKDVLILELLRFAHDLRGTAGLPLPKERLAKARVSSRELAMAEELIESMRSDWAPAKYRDQYHDDLLALIERKAKTGKVEAPTRRAVPRGNVVDLMKLLRKSVQAQRRDRSDDEAPESRRVAKRSASKRRGGHEGGGRRKRGSGAEAA
jgi:DNA end-binding protein Ku